MARGERRKCKSCLKLFRPHPRSLGRQQYCSAALCKRASKAASQARWLAKPENRDYFRHPVHVARVREWRARNVGSDGLQELKVAQVIDPESETNNFAMRSLQGTLQEIITAQPAVLLGLIAHLVGTPLQKDIVPVARRLLRMGQDILAASEVGRRTRRNTPRRRVPVT
jgi:hypothetical protein